MTVGLLADAAVPVGEIPADGVSLTHTGRLGPVFGLSIRNALFTVVTLLLYRFWARTDVRRYLWDRTEIARERLEWSGNGLELFAGFLLITVLIIFPLFGAYTLLNLLFPEHPAFNVLLPALIPVAVFLLGVGIYRAHRYRLSRTLWRGVRFGLAGSALAFGGLLLLYSILSVVTLGWFVPVMRYRLMRRMLNNTYFGDVPFSFEGKLGPLYKRFAIAYVLGIGLTFLGIYIVGPYFHMFIEDLFGSSTFWASKHLPPPLVYPFILFVAALPTILVAMLISFAGFYYLAGEYRQFAANTKLDGLGFTLDVHSLRLYWVSLSNLVLAVVTLGIALPVAQWRKIRYLIGHMTIEGETDLDAIGQSTIKPPVTGEGLSELVGLGTI